MAKFPALPLWTDAWVADTHHLRVCERGLYIDLLILMWRSPKCRVPNDEIWLAKHLGVPAKDFKPLIKEFCQCDGNHITQKRLLREFFYLRKRRAQQSARAKVRWRKEKDMCRSDAASGNALSTPTPTPIIEEAKASSISIGARKRASRLPEDWQPSEKDLDYAKTHGLNTAHVTIEAERFRNYWTAKAGNGATKLDWSATWRNWILKAAEANGHDPSIVQRREPVPKPRPIRQEENENHEIGSEEFEHPASWRSA